MVDIVRCKLCKEKIVDISKLVDHLAKKHRDEIPEGFSPERYAYFLVKGKDSGRCVECKRETEFNDITMKYNRFCDDPSCKDLYRERFKKRMISKHGKVHKLDEPETQRKMLSERTIAKDYVWSNGTTTRVIGSYEYDFLRFLDLFMEYSPDDVMVPSPHTYVYKYKGKNHFYIPDAYIPSLNLEIEIKDGGDNPNTHPKIQNVDKVKEKLKDEVLISQKDKKYMKIVNKEYDGFLRFLIKEKNIILNGGK